MKKFISTLSLSITLISCSHKERAIEKSPITTPTPPSAASKDPFSPTRAQAVIKSVPGSKVKGVVHFSETDGIMTVELLMEGLKPGPHGFHIHEKGDCSAKDFSSAGGHFNPSQHPHAGPNAKERHSGDLGNIFASKKGTTNTKMQVPGTTMSSGPDSIIGKSVIVHEEADDLKSQPAGNSGRRIGCGIIEAL